MTGPSTTTTTAVGVGSTVVTPDNTVAVVDIVRGTQAEVAWFVGHDVKRAAFDLSELRLATDDEILASDDAYKTSLLTDGVFDGIEAAPSTPTHALGGTIGDTSRLLITFLGWLATRDERVGPFSRIDLPTAPVQAARIVSEFLAADQS